MMALAGFNHVAVLTTDLDRLVAFSRRVFGAEAVYDGTDGGRRHALIDVGGSGLLHALVVAPGEMPPADRPRCQRGRLDHFGVTAPTRECFLELRRRALEADATDGQV